MPGYWPGERRKERTRLRVKKPENSRAPFFIRLLIGNLCSLNTKKFLLWLFSWFLWLLRTAVVKILDFLTRYHSYQLKNRMKKEPCELSSFLALGRVVWFLSSRPSCLVSWRSAELCGFLALSRVVSFHISPDDMLISSTFMDYFV